MKGNEDRVSLLTSSQIDFNAMSRPRHAEGSGIRWIAVLNLDAHIAKENSAITALSACSNPIRRATTSTAGYALGPNRRMYSSER